MCKVCTMVQTEWWHRPGQEESLEVVWEVALEAHDVSLQVGCHAVICVEITLGHWMWDLDKIWQVGKDAWKGRAGKLTKGGPG